MQLSAMPRRDNVLTISNHIAFAFVIACLINVGVSTKLKAHTDIVSPNGRNSISLQTGEAGVKFEIRRDGKLLIGPSRMGCELSNGRILGASASEPARVQHNTVDASFELLWGKTTRARDHCNTGSIELVDASGLRWKVDLRAYDDGVAFRYRIHMQAGMRTCAIRDEATEFDVADLPTVHYMPLKSFTTSHEALYRRSSITDIPPGSLLDCPLLIDWSEGPSAAITEAKILDFAGAYLRRESATATKLSVRLSPHPSKAGVSVIGTNALTSPWRVVLLADDAGEMLESNLLLCLNDPPKETGGGYQWVVPGKTSFHWWNGEFERDHEINDDGQTFVTRHKRYIDFCAANGIRYHGLSGDGRAWYPQSSQRYGIASADANICIARPELKLPEIFEYADQKGVGIRLWVHWKPLSEQLEEALETYEQWGVKGLMVDFLNRDDQAMNRFTQRMLRSASEHHLHIQIHGSSKPGGEQRTFPHLLNREGVLNLESSKWSKQCDPQHNVNVAYTRALAGPVDYHSGGFRNVSRKQFQPRQLNPAVLGSRCHHLAMFIVYENPMPMVADTPESYKRQIGFDFIKNVPVTWTETRFLVGIPGEFIAVARRSEGQWYFGGMNNWSPREVEISLELLSTGDWELTLLRDESMDDSEPALATKLKQDVNASTVLRIPMAPGGGFAGVIRRK